MRAPASTPPVRSTGGDAASGAGLRWRSPLALAAAAVLVGTAVVAVTLVRMRAGFLVRGDRAIELDANAAVRASPWLLTAAKVLGHVGGALARWVLAGVVLAGLAWRRQWRAALWLAVTFFGGLLIANGCRLAVDRPRPHLPHPVVPSPGGASFPSGHAMGCVALFGGLVVLAAPWLSRALRWAAGSLAALLALAVGTSRVLVGLHFTSDVLTGLVFGAAWLALVTAAFPPWPGRPVR